MSNSNLSICAILTVIGTLSFGGKVFSEAPQGYLYPTCQNIVNDFLSRGEQACRGEGDHTFQEELELLQSQLYEARCPVGCVEFRCQANYLYQQDLHNCYHLIE